MLKGLLPIGQKKEQKNSWDFAAFRKSVRVTEQQKQTFQKPLLAAWGRVSAAPRKLLLLGFAGVRRGLTCGSGLLFHAFRSSLLWKSAARKCLQKVLLTVTAASTHWAPTQVCVQGTWSAEPSWTPSNCKNKLVPICFPVLKWGWGQSRTERSIFPNLCCFLPGHQNRDVSCSTYGVPLENNFFRFWTYPSLRRLRPKSMEWSEGHYLIQIWGHPVVLPT